MGDPVYDFLNSGGKTPAAPAAAPSGKPSNDPVYEFLNSGGKSLPPVQEKAPEAPVVKSVKDYSPDNTTTPEVIAHLGSSIAGSVYGGWKGLAALASGGTLEDAANAVHEGAEQITYQPKGEEAKKVVGQIESNANPLVAAGTLAKKGGELAQDYLGASPAIATGIEVVGNAIIPAGALKAAKVPLRIVKGAEEPVRGAPAVESRIEPTLEQQAATAQAKLKATTEWEAAQRDLTQALNNPNTPKQTIDQLQTRAAVAEDAAKRMEAAPKPLELAPAEQARARVTPDDRLPAETGVTPEPTNFLDSAPESATAVDKASRAATLQRIGLSEARASAITGDAKAAATDYQQSKLTNAAGDYMRSVLDNERAGLTNYAESIVRDTGGTIGTDSSALYSRGNTILAPLDKLKQWFDSETSKLYKEADAKAGGQPVSMPKTQEFVGGDQAEFLGTTEGESLLKGVKARMKSLGMIDGDGNPQPVTVKQAEQLKQYLNNQWQPRTARLIRCLKDAIDEDVTSTGPDIYQKARAMRAMRAVTLDDPNGIAKLLDASGPDGINRAVPVEKIADTITGLPADQLGHIVKTLKNVPKELQPQAEAALAEIKAQFANKILDAGSSRVGQWGARDVSKYLNNNAARLQQVFTSSELDKLNDLNNAGHILAKDQSYPGAAVQEHNLVQRGAMAGVRSGATAVGGALGGAPGAAAGGFVGDMAAKALGERSALKSTQKRVIKLSDFPGINE